VDQFENFDIKYKEYTFSVVAEAFVVLFFFCRFVFFENEAGLIFIF